MCIITCVIDLFYFSYYNLEVVSDESVNTFLSKIVEKIINDLSQSYCLVVDEVCDDSIHMCSFDVTLVLHRMVTAYHHCCVDVWHRITTYTIPQ